MAPPDRKALAEAGRKKLEEFRKAKANKASPIKNGDVTGLDTSIIPPPADLQPTFATPSLTANEPWQPLQTAPKDLQATTAFMTQPVPEPATSFVVVAEGAIPFASTPVKPKPEESHPHPSSSDPYASHGDSVDDAAAPSAVKDLSTTGGIVQTPAWSTTDSYNYSQQHPFSYAGNQPAGNQSQAIPFANSTQPADASASWFSEGAAASSHANAASMSSFLTEGSQPALEPTGWQPAGAEGANSTTMYSVYSPTPQLLEAPAESHQQTTGASTTLLDAAPWTGSDAAPGACSAEAVPSHGWEQGLGSSSIAASWQSHHPVHSTNLNAATMQQQQQQPAHSFTADHALRQHEIFNNFSSATDTPYSLAAAHMSDAAQHTSTWQPVITATNMQTGLDWQLTPYDGQAGTEQVGQLDASLSGSAGGATPWQPSPLDLYDQQNSAAAAVGQEDPNHNTYPAANIDEAPTASPATYSNTQLESSGMYTLQTDDAGVGPALVSDESYTHVATPVESIATQPQPASSAYAALSDTYLQQPLAAPASTYSSLADSYLAQPGPSDTPDVAPAPIDAEATQPVAQQTPAEGGTVDGENTLATQIPAEEQQQPGASPSTAVGTSGVLPPPPTVSWWSQPHPPLTGHTATHSYTQMSTAVPAPAPSAAPSSNVYSAYTSLSDNYLRAADVASGHTIQPSSYSNWKQAAAMSQPADVGPTVEVSESVARAPDTAQAVSAPEGGAAAGAPLSVAFDAPDSNNLKGAIDVPPAQESDQSASLVDAFAQFVKDDESERPKQAATPAKGGRFAWLFGRPNSNTTPTKPAQQEQPITTHNQQELLEPAPAVEVQSQAHEHEPPAAPTEAAAAAAAASSIDDVPRGDGINHEQQHSQYGDSRHQSHPAQIVDVFSAFKPAASNHDAEPSARVISLAGWRSSSRTATQDDHEVHQGGDGISTTTSHADATHTFLPSVPAVSAAPAVDFYGAEQSPASARSTVPTLPLWASSQPNTIHATSNVYTGTAITTASTANGTGEFQAAGTTTAEPLSSSLPQDTPGTREQVPSGTAWSTSLHPPARPSFLSGVHSRSQSTSQPAAGDLPSAPSQSSLSKLEPASTSKPWTGSSAHNYASASDYFLSSSVYNTAAGSKGYTSASGIAAALPTSKAQPSFLESYLDNLLRPSSAAGSAGPSAGVASMSRADSEATATASQQGAAQDGSHETGTIEDVQGLGEAAPGFSDVTALPGQGGQGVQGEGHNGGEQDVAGFRAQDAMPGHDVGLTSFGHKGAHTGTLTFSQASGFEAAQAGQAQQRAQFSALQQHIDELTSEKLELQRGLAAQGRIASELAEENSGLVERLNAQGKTVEALQKKLKQYEDELSAQALAMEAMAGEREATKVAMQEAVSRSSALASENVELEASLLEAKSSALKAEREAAEAAAKAAKLEKVLVKQRAESARVVEEAGKLAQEKRALFVRLKQTESRLNKVLDEHRVSSRARESLLAGLSPVAASTADSEVQCELLLHSEVTALEEALAAARLTSDTAAQEAQSAKEAQAAAETRAEELQAQHALLQEQAQQAQQQLALAGGAPDRQALAAAAPAGVDLISDLLEGVRLSAATSDPPSAIIADRALASLPALATRGKPSQSAGPLDSTTKAVTDLAKWLPHGPVTANSTVAAMAEEEVRLVGSIHALLSEYEAAHLSALEDLKASQATINTLRAANADLYSKLEMTTQRLELVLSQGAAASSVFGSTRVPVSAGDSVAGLSDQGLPQLATQQSEEAQAGAGQGQQSLPDPVTPLHSSYPPATPESGTGLQMVGDPVVEEATRAAVLAESLQSGTPTRRGGLLGFLFARPARPKKRIRSAML